LIVIKAAGGHTGIVVRATALKGAKAKRLMGLTVPGNGATIT
jgi:hypothetical protein